MAGRLFEAVEGISSGDDEPPVLEQSLPPPPNRVLALPPPPNRVLAPPPRAKPPTRSTVVESEAPPSSSVPSRASASYGPSASSAVTAALVPGPVDDWNNYAVRIKAGAAARRAAASDAKSWLKPKPQSQLDVFKSEATARAKAIQSGKVGAVHTYPSASCGRGGGRGRGCSGRSTSNAASSSLPPPSLPTNDDEAASAAPTVPYAEDGIGGTHFSTTVRPMTHAGRFCPESGCD